MQPDKKFKSPPKNQIHVLTNLYFSGKLTKAENLCRKLIQRFPESVLLLNFLGVIFKTQGQLSKALMTFEDALKLKHDYPIVHNNKGATLNDLGKYDDAIDSFRLALHFKPDYAEAYNNFGNALYALGKANDAFVYYLKAIHYKPDYEEAYINLANTAYKIKKFDEAIKYYDQAIQLNPKNAEAHNQKGLALKAIDRFEEAIKSYQKAIQLQPNYPEALANCGVAFGELLLPDKAIRCFDRALKLEPAFAVAYNNKGNILHQIGETDKAIQNYNKAIQTRPNYALAHYHLSILKEYRKEDPHIIELEQLIENSGLKESDLMYLCFALSKAYDDIGDYDKSFALLNNGNAIRKKQIDYDFNADNQLFNCTIKLFEKEEFDTFLYNKVPEIQPIFIVGMPRSGTSLVEQILSSHPKVHGAGELEAMSKLLTPMLVNRLPLRNRTNDAQHFRIIIQKLHENYLAVLESLKVNEKFITDKMPLNFRWIGFVLLAFPEAKIINVNRNACAICWSIYKHYFTNKGLGFTSDLEDIVHFYKLYTKLMKFWHIHFPGKIYDLNYEKLTENQESETHKLLSYCNLEMEKKCLDFHKTKRVIKTASANQVRKKMYKGSSEAWKKYKKHIQPFLNHLITKDK